MSWAGRAVTGTPSAAAPSKRPAVIDGELVYTSVSAIQKWNSCGAQWWFRYVKGLPDEPPGKAQLRGLQGHKRIETYLKTGTDVLDRLERLGLKYMPTPNVVDGVRTPGPQLIVEEGFADWKLLYAQARGETKGVPIVGYLDLMNPRLVEEQGLLEIKDWKFKKTLEYAATSEQLIDPTDDAGIQMLGYGELGRLRYPNARIIRLAHVTFQREGQADCIESAVDVPLDTVRAGWETVTQAAIPGMRRAARAISHLEVPKNETVCHKYRKPCPYIGTCLDRMARLNQGFRRSGVPASAVQPPAGETKMGMLSSMTSTTPAAVPIQPIQTQSAPPPPTPSRMPIHDIPTGAIEASTCEQNKDYTVQGVVCRFLCGTTLGTSRFMSFIPLTGGAPVLVAPEAAVFPVVAAPVQVTGGSFSGAPGVSAAAPAAALPLVVPPDAPKSDPALASKPAPGTVPEAPAATKRTRRTKEQIAADAAAALPAAPATIAVVPIHAESASPASSVTAPSPGTSQPVAGPMEGVHLYFGCSPIGVLVSSLASYVSSIEADVLKLGQLNVGDIRNSNDKVFGFSMWKGYLAQAAKETPPPPGFYVVTYGDEREEVIAKALADIAKPGFVTRGGGR